MEDVRERKSMVRVGRAAVASRIGPVAPPTRSNGVDCQHFARMVDMNSLKSNILDEHQENVQLYFGNLDFDVENFEQLFLLYGQLSLQEYIFHFGF